MTFETCVIYQSPPCIAPEFIYVPSVGRIIKQDQEIGEMKKKIAEVMAVMPSITYTAPYPIVPNLTKFLSSEDCVLDRTALMYQCLKK